MNKGLFSKILQRGRILSAMANGSQNVYVVAMNYMGQPGGTNRPFSDFNQKGGTTSAATPSSTKETKDKSKTDANKLNQTQK